MEDRLAQLLFSQAIGKPGNITSMPGRATIWKMPPMGWAMAAVAAVALAIPAAASLKYMVGMWSSKEEFSYAYMIPLVAALQIWQKKEILERIPFPGSWAGLLVVLLGFALTVAGKLSTLHVIVQYAFVLATTGLVLALTGWQAFKLIWIALLLLVFMIPLPQFLLQEISAQLQLISSELGVAMIRVLGISVFLEGNVIDLGRYKLQVAEACSGLRYLFPLMALGFIAASYFNGAAWKRVTIFLSTIPITVLMNSFRIAMIGVLVAYRGQSMAEGFLHDFEGWVIFMGCTGLLIAEMALLARIGSGGVPFRRAFGLEWPAPAPADGQIQCRALPKPWLASVAACVALAMLAAVLPDRVELQPPRKAFSDFPMQLGEWTGMGDHLEQVYLDVLKLDDYVLADFSDGSNDVINFYAAFYASQRTGESAHSPRTCIPGGGWTITSLTSKTVEAAKVGGEPLRVNRAIIQLGDRKQLVYYWFQQRGRVITNEYLVKWFIFWDSLTKSRTDGALLRLMTPLKPWEDVTIADQRLSAFAGLVSGQIEAYVPP